MKIIFSKAYDGTLYKQISDKKRYVGVVSLLTILERELGLYREYPSSEIRLKAYIQCLKESIKGSFYEDSLSADQFTVGQQLLALRDELVFSGWNSNLKEQPRRLSDLAKVDDLFKQNSSHIGIADRWSTVSNTLTEDNIHEIDFELVISDKEEFIYPLLQSVFNKLGAKYDSGIKCEENDSNLSKLTNSLSKSLKHSPELTELNFNHFNDDQSLVLLKFKNKQELVDSIAFLSNQEEHLLISNDSVDLDFSSVSFGKNAIGSVQKQSNPQLIQLFKLIIPCFSNEFNLQTFLSFLQLKDSPLPYELKTSMVKVVIEKPGFGNDKWNSIIDQFINGEIDNEIELSKVKREELVDLFLTFDSLPELESVEKAKKIISYLLKWSGKKLHSNESLKLKEQFAFLVDLFKKVESLISEESSILAIEKAFEIVYESGNFTNYAKQENSVACVSDFSKITSNCTKTVIVTDFYGDFSSTDLSKKLLIEEQLFLKENQCFYNAYFDLLLSQQMKGLSHITKQLILCYIEEETIEKHPFHIRLEALFHNVNEAICISINELDDLTKSFPNAFQIETLQKVNEIKLPEASLYFESDLLKKITKREKESASSIEKFIQHPFDWVLENKLQMRSFQGLNLGRENQLKGNITHKIIENLLNKRKSDKFELIKIEASELDNEFDKVVKQEGILFLQPEKRFELSEFKMKFKTSFNGLIDIINTNELAIFSCEYSFGKEESLYFEEIDNQAVGYIDLTLKNKLEEFVIIDLKWTFSKSKFISKIKKNEAIQLAIYALAVGQKEVAKTGYFLLSQNLLITAADIQGRNVERIPEEYSNNEILIKIKASLEERWKELKNGKLEIGDSLDLEDLDYYSKVDLISLPEDKDGKSKKSNDYSGFELFKGKLN